MARPIKNNADYFTHDADMRNDARVKALRKKHGLDGYAIYIMAIEYLTDSDFFQFKNDTLTFELISCDFECDPEKIQKVIDYCVYLDLFQLKEGGYIHCQTLEKRLQSLISKRKLDRSRVIAAETSDNTYSKVKKSKVKNKEKIGADAPPIKSIEERKEDFYQQLVPHVKTYGKNMVRKFFEYWTESSKGAKRFRMEKEKVFDINQRLVRWAAKEKTYNPDADQPPKPEEKYSDARFNKTLWTDEVWRSTYAAQIKNDEAFRKEFHL